MELLKRVLDQLPSGPANRGEIAVYLTALIDWLNTDPWPQDERFRGPALTPAVIERKLRITARGKGGDQDLDADQLARHCRRLVILGGPGAGKTWLAKRTARRCAVEALKALTEGAALDEIELPLYTTCSRLLTATGDPRSAAVSSALDYELGDLGGSRLNAAVRVFFTERNAATVLVIDSLDEAQGIGKRLRQVDTLPWRIVLTSRPSSWNNQLSIDERNRTHRVGELQPLRYPDDVEPFIQRWFREKPAWGNDLAAQIALRPGLQQAATVPLILAFYCIIGGDQPLPELRRDLYTKVLNRMLTGRWRGDDDGRPDASVCLTKLRSWAWSGATWNPVSQVGTWADDIATPAARLSKAAEDAVDHVAVPVSAVDIDTGRTRRRFVHRSLREHLVADHVAGLVVDEAAEILLPHVWDDLDWEYTAPAAVAMHPQHDQLLRDLICRAARSEQIVADLSVIDPWWEFHGFLARIAAESSEDDWSAEISSLVGYSRIQLAQSVQLRDLSDSDRIEAIDPTRVRIVRSVQLRHLVETAHWGTSNRQVREALLKHVDRSPAVRDLVDALIRLDPPEEDKLLARQALLRKLASGHISLSLPSLADALIGLEASEEDKLLARQALLRRPALSPILVDALIRLDPPEEDKLLARQALLRSFASEHSHLPFLVDALIRLDPPEEDKLLARQALLIFLAHHRNGVAEARELVNGLITLGPSEEDRHLARQMLLSRLTSPESIYGGPLEPVGSIYDQVVAGIMDLRVSAAMDGLVQLASSDEDRYHTRQSLFEILDSQQTSGQVAYKLVDGMIRLGLSAEDGHQARQTLLRHLSSHQGGSMELRQLMEGLIQLHPSPEESSLAFQVLLRHLAGRQDSHWGSRELVRQMIQISSSAGDTRQASGALLSFLTRRQAGGPDPDVLIGGLLELGLSDEDKGLAREALLGQLAGEPGPMTVAIDVVPKLARLEPSAEESTLTRQVLLTYLSDPATGPDAVVCCARELTKLEPSAQERILARQALLGYLSDPATDRRKIGDLARELTKLEPSAQERILARQALLRYLSDPATVEYIHADIERGLAGLAPTVEDLTTWRAWTFPPTAALLATVRANSTLADWIESLRPLSNTKNTGVIMPNNGGFQHYIDSSTGPEEIMNERPISALCGWTWIPRKFALAGGSIDNLPVCPNCQSAYDLMAGEK